MVIEGRVTGVMETWPLQLTLRTDDVTYHIILSDDTAIYAEGQERSPADIRPGLMVRIQGDASGPRGMSATRIQLMGVH
jgi:hypothetical protein